MNFSLADKRILVLGFGKTGEACVNFLLQQGAKITVNDNKARTDFDTEKLSMYEQKGVQFYFGQHSADMCLASDNVIISPGVEPGWLPRAEMTKKNIALMSEIELACRFAEGKIIGVTGTNGKTTVTTLLGQIFEKAGYSIAVCGNIGFPFIQAVQQKKSYDYYIIEISSFQLEAITLFRAHGALLLNISTDHMDRYATLREYLFAKWNIFRNQQQGDWAVLNEMQDHYWKEMPEINSSVWKFSSADAVKRGCFLRNSKIYYQDKTGEQEVMSIDEISLPGVHNIENIMACIIAGLQEGLSLETIRGAIAAFKGLPHRMELVAVQEGITFINDSKATNPDAVVKALESFQKNVIIILGGKDKQLGYKELAEPVRKHVKTGILIGEASRLIYDAIKDTGVYLEHAGSMHEAVKRAYMLSQQGDVILLSPACASFDMFQDYVDRGNSFKRAVHEIIGQNSNKGVTA